MRSNLRTVLLVLLLAVAGCAGDRPTKSPVAEQQPGLAEMMAIAPGPDGAEARRDQAQLGDAPNFEVTSVEAGSGGVVVQRCAVLRQVQAARPHADHVCSAGVGGFPLKLRVTAPIAVNLPREWAAVDQLMGIPAATLTRAASGDAHSTQRAHMRDPATGSDDT